MHSFLALFAVIILGLTSPAALAQLPIARLSAAFPPGGKAGTTFDVTLSGTDLDDVGKLHFSHAGITAKPKTVAGTGQPEANKFVVSVAADVPFGAYEARTVGRFGISNPRAFVVSDTAESIEPTGNNSAESAAEITLESTVNGRCDANAADFYKFNARKGQRILVEVLDRQIDSRLEGVVAVYDNVGHELERNRRGGLLDFTAPAEAKYILRVHDSLFRGGDEFFYRMSVGTGPRLDFAFPPAGLPGSKGKYDLYGRNLPGGSPTEFTIEGKPLEKLTVEIELPNRSEPHGVFSPNILLPPPHPALDGIAYHLTVPSEGGHPKRVSNSVFLGFATGPVVPEQKSNDTASTAEKINIPCEFAGQFYPKGDRDWLTFEAKKGVVYWLELFSDRLGLPTDPYFLVQRVTKNDKGEEKTNDVQELYDTETNIGGLEFNTASRDPAWRFDVKEDGVYRVAVRDLFNSSKSDASFVYRLSIRNETADFRLVAIAQAPPPAQKDKKEALLWTPFVRRGETMALKVLAYRRDNFTGPIQLKVEGLPKEVHAGAATIESGQTSTLVMLTADENAPAWVGSIKIVGSARSGDTQITRTARSGSLLWNVPDANDALVQSRMARELLLAVSDKELTPLSVGPDGTNTFETSLAGKVQIPVRVVRHGDFNDVIKVKPAGLAVLDPVKEIDVTKTNTARFEIDLTKIKLPVGSHAFYLQAQSKGKHRRMQPDEVKAIETSAKAAEDAAKQAAKTADELAKAAKGAADALAAAAKAVEKTEAAVKAAREKLAAAKSATDQTSNEETAPVKSAEMALADATAQAQAALAAKTAAEKMATDASAKAKDAEGKKAGAQAIAAHFAQEAKGAAQKGQAKDVTFSTYSMPLILKIAPAPIKIYTEPSAGELMAGAKVEIPVRLNRLYGFNESVELTLVLPKESGGLQAAKVTIPKDQSEGRLVVEAAQTATPGERKLSVQAAVKFNGQDLKLDQPITLKVAAAK